MTLKSGRSASAGSMRTALSDLYLEHLLQNRAKPEVSGGRRQPRAATAAAPPRERDSDPSIPRAPFLPGPVREPQGGPSYVPLVSCWPLAQHPVPWGPLHPVLPVQTREAGPLRQRPDGRQETDIHVCALHVALLVPSTSGAGLFAEGTLGEWSASVAGQGRRS